jgi:hypothetical protein
MRIATLPSHVDVMFYSEYLRNPLLNLRYKAVKLLYLKQNPEI